MSIQQFLEELLAAEAFEQQRINGYEEILAMPENLLSEASRDEVQDALAWSTDRHALITEASVCIIALIDYNYPGRVQQIAQESAILELNERLEAMRLAVAEFITAPTGTLTVSDEIPID